jgi:hypothetical protein
VHMNSSWVKAERFSSYLQGLYCIKASLVKLKLKIALTVIITGSLGAVIINFIRVYFVGFLCYYSKKFKEEAVLQC